MIEILLFSLAYTVKGGSLLEVKRIKNNKILRHLLAGKAQAFAIVLLGMMLFLHPVSALIVALGFLAAVAPSIGEEQGAIGDYLGELPAYNKSDRGRRYDVKKGLQRGVFMGACMALATGSTLFIASSVLFIPVAWIGQTLNFKILKVRGWTIAEPIIGAVVFGTPFLFL